MDIPGRAHLGLCVKTKDIKNFKLVKDRSGEECRPKDPSIEGDDPGSQTCRKLKNELECREQAFLCKWGPTNIENKPQDEWEQQLAAVVVPPPPKGSCRFNKESKNPNAPSGPERDYIKKASSICFEQKDEDKCQIEKDWSDSLGEAKVLIYPDEAEIKKAKEEKEKIDAQMAEMMKMTTGLGPGAAPAAAPEEEEEEERRDTGGVLEQGGGKRSKTIR